jgi:hypothetical protein
MSSTVRHTLRFQLSINNYLLNPYLINSAAFSYSSLTIHLPHSGYTVYKLQLHSDMLARLHCQSDCWKKTEKFAVVENDRNHKTTVVAFNTYVGVKANGMKAIIESRVCTHVQITHSVYSYITAA